MHVWCVVKDLWTINIVLLHYGLSIVNCKIKLDYTDGD